MLQDEVGLGRLRERTAAAHRLGMRAKAYYTIRELSNHAPELCVPEPRTAHRCRRARSVRGAPPRPLVHGACCLQVGAALARQRGAARRERRSKPETLLQTELAREDHTESWVRRTGDWKFALLTEIDEPRLFSVLQA